MNISNVNYNLFEAFFLVYEHKNLSRAAEQLGFTTGAVSKQIKELEAQLNLKLIFPQQRGVVLTREADELYKLAKPHFAGLKNLANAINDVNENTEGIIRVGIPTHIYSAVLVKYFCDFKRKFPKIKIKIDSNRKLEQLEKLARRDIDIVINSLPIVNGNFKVETIKELPKTFFATKTYLRSNGIKEVTSIKDLAKSTFILPCKSRNDIKALIESLNINLESVIEVSGGTEILFSTVLQDIGIGYCTEDYLNYRNDERIAKLKLDMPLPKYRLSLVYNQDDTSKIMQEFTRGLKRFLL